MILFLLVADVAAHGESPFALVEDELGERTVDKAVFVVVLHCERLVFREVDDGETLVVVGVEHTVLKLNMLHDIDIEFGVYTVERRVCHFQNIDMQHVGIKTIFGVHFLTISTAHFYDADSAFGGSYKRASVVDKVAMDIP